MSSGVCILFCQCYYCLLCREAEVVLNYKTKYLKKRPKVTKTKMHAGHSALIHNVIAKYIHHMPRWGFYDLPMPMNTICYLQGLKSREIPFVHTLFLSWPIVLKFCSYYDIITAVPFATFHNNRTTELKYKLRTNSWGVSVVEGGYPILQQHPA